MFPFPTELILQVLLHVDVRDIKSLIDSGCVPPTLFNLTLHHHGSPFYFTNEALKVTFSIDDCHHPENCYVNLVELDYDQLDKDFDPRRLYNAYKHGTINFIVLTYTDQRLEDGFNRVLASMTVSLPTNSRILVYDTNKCRLTVPESPQSSSLAVEKCQHLLIDGLQYDQTLNLSGIQHLGLAEIASSEALEVVYFSEDPSFLLDIRSRHSLVDILDKHICATNLRVEGFNQIEDVLFLGKSMVLSSNAEDSRWLSDIEAPNMTTLQVRCTVDPHASDLDFKSLKKLKYRCDTTDEGSYFYKVIQRFPSLEYLEIVSPFNAHLILQSLEPNAFLNLKYLRFKVSREHISSKDKVYGPFPNLERLKVHCLMWRDTFTPKFEAPKLKEYRLRIRQFTDSDLGDVASSLESFPLLERLHIRMRKHAYYDGIEHLEEALVKRLSKTLVHLEVDGLDPAELWQNKEAHFPKLQTLVIKNNDSKLRTRAFQFKAPLLQRLEVKGWVYANAVSVSGFPSLTNVKCSEMEVRHYLLENLPVLTEADLSSSDLESIKTVNAPKLAKLRYCLQHCDEIIDEETVELLETNPHAVVERYRDRSYYRQYNEESDLDSVEDVDLFDPYQGQKEAMKEKFTKRSNIPRIGLLPLGPKERFEGYNASDIENIEDNWRAEREAECEEFGMEFNRVAQEDVLWEKFVELLAAEEAEYLPSDDDMDGGEEGFW